MRARTALLPLLAITGCIDGDRAADGGACPLDETCSSKTPDGLQFEGTSTMDSISIGPAVTAVGGTQRIDVLISRHGREVPLDIEYRAKGGSRVVVDHTEGATVIVRGATTGADKLRIVDPGTGALFDRTTVITREIDRLDLVFGFLETPSDPTIGAVLAAGDQTFGVALQSSPASDGKRTRLVDTSMTLALAGAMQTEWDTLHMPAAAVGTSTITVTAGGVARSLELEVVAGADAIVVVPTSTPLVAGTDGLACFEARNAGRFVGGLRDWTFTTDNGTVGGALRSGCVVLKPATAGPAHVRATAGGAALDVTLTVAASARVAAPATLDEPSLRAGDRARALGN